MEQTVKDFLYLVYSAVNRTTIERKKLLNLDMDSLYQFSLAHQMTAIVAYGLDLADIKDDRFIDARLRTINHIVVLDYEYRIIADKLKKTGIWYMPLKGMLLKEYYPYKGMREMCDVDILYDSKRSLELKNIMETDGFNLIPPDGIEHQEVYRKPPVCVFEMHPMLFDSWTDEKYCLYYKDVVSKLLGDGYEKHFSDEDFYIYMITHVHKHYCWGGIGLRALLDIYVFLKRFNGTLDWEYIYSETQKIGVGDFEKKSRAIAEKVFGTGKTDELSAEEKEMWNYYVHSGAYGKKEFAIRNRINRIGFLQYFKERVFLPLKGVKYHYPLFYKYKVLLPLLPVYRLIHGRKNALSEIKTIRKLTSKKR